MLDRSILVCLLAACGPDQRAAPVHADPPPAAPVVTPPPVAARPAIVAPTPSWPRPHKPCVDGPTEEKCLLERYRASYDRLQGMEVGGMEEMLGEAFAGSAALAAAITPPDKTAPGVAACNALSRAELTVPLESLRRPQRDCFFDCLHKPDELACIRDHGCVRLPALDGAWQLVTLVPRLGCLAALLTDNRVKAPARCMGLAGEADSPVGSTIACAPRKMCEAGVSGVPDQIAPYVLYNGTDCAVLPASWWCTQVKQSYPRAACAFGS